MDDDRQQVSGGINHPVPLNMMQSAADAQANFTNQQQANKQ